MDNSMFERDFSKKTIKALRAKGITIIGMQAAPGFPGDVYFSGVSYTLNDNDTCKIRSLLEVIAMAES